MKISFGQPIWLLVNLEHPNFYVYIYFQLKILKYGQLFLHETLLNTSRVGRSMQEKVENVLFKSMTHKTSTIVSCVN